MGARATSDERVREAVPFAVRVAGAWSWPLIGFGIVAIGLLALVVTLREVTIPFVIAVLLTGLLWPIRRNLTARGVPKVLTVVVPFVGLLIGIAGLVTLVVFTVRAGADGFVPHFLKSYRELLEFLHGAPFNVSNAQVASAFTSAETALKANSSKIAAGALAGADVAAHFGIGLVLTLFVTLFLLIDGPRIWHWVVHLSPRRAHAAIDGAGLAAWHSIGEYARVQVIVAATDAVGVGVIAFILHVPFPVPVAVLVFLGAFIPIVGSVTAGILAVLIALVYNGPINAVVMLGGVLLVNQIESHLLHPLLMGGAVRLHPIAVVLAVASGSVLAGIIGALFAVPLTAAANSAVTYLAGGEWKRRDDPTADPPPAEEDPAPQEVTTVA